MPKLRILAHVCFELGKSGQVHNQGPDGHAAVEAKF
jgi:hypothetical protein